MSDPCKVYVAVVMTPEHFDEYDPDDGSFVDFCYDKYEIFTYKNSLREEQRLPETISFGYENPQSGGIGHQSDRAKAGSGNDCIVACHLGRSRSGSYLGGRGRVNRYCFSA